MSSQNKKEKETNEERIFNEVDNVILFYKNEK